MNKKYIVRLTKEELEMTRELISKRKASVHNIKHANILLKVDADGENWIDERCANAFSIHTNTVCSIRQSFVEKGIDAVLNRKNR